ncbi:MAG: PAS domain S-box protein, partial [Methanoregula sp.]|nr:PAS domain S-box protein [Methanoregula sp.]
MEIQDGFIMTETWWKAVIVSSAGIVIALTAWCLSQGITTIFMHLYYIPIVLLAYHYRKKGILPCILLGLAYLALVIMYDPDNPATIEGALIRVIVFIGIAALVAYLAQNLVTAKDRLKSVADIQQGIVQNANVWLMVLDKDGRIREWNHAAETISGYPAEDVIGKNTIWKRLYPDGEYRKEITGKIAEIIAQHNYLENLRTTITSKDGTQKTILWNTRDLPGNPGGSPRYIAIGVDITERTDAETALKESDAKYRTLFENLLEGLAYCRMIYDDQGRPVDWIYLTVNRSFERLTGLNDVKGKRVLEVIPDIRTLNPEIFDTYGRIAETGIPETFEIDFKPLNTWMRISAFSPEKGYFVAVFDDITEHKHIEDEVRDARDFYLLILDDFPNPVWRADVNGKCDYFNKNWLAFTGRTIGQELGDGWAEGVHPDDIDRCLKIYLDHFNARTPFEMEYRLRYHDGTYHWLLDFGKPLFTKDGKFSGYIGSCYDIHDRKMAVEALQTSEHRSAILLEAIPDLMFVITRDGTYRDFHVSDTSVLAMPPDRIIGTNIRDSGFGKESVERILHHVGQALETRILQQFEYELVVPRGKRQFEARMVALNEDAALGIIRDITESRQAEEALALEKQRMESLLSLTQTDQADKEILSTVVEDAIRLTGSTIGYLATMNDDESVMTMQYWSKTAHESCRIITKPLVYPLEKTGLWGEAVRQRKPIVTNAYAAESPFKRGTPEGHVPLVRHMNIPVFDGDRIVAVAGVGNKGVDYNEGDVRQLQLLMQGWWQIVVRRRAEVALRESEEKYRAFFTTARDCIFITTTDGKWVDFNDAAVGLFGYESREDLINTTIASVYANPHERDSHIRYIRKNGYSFEYPVDLRKKDGTIINALITTVARKDASGNIIGFQGSIRDITERKRMENALRESEARLNSIIHGSPMLQFVIDKNHRVISWNKAIEEFSGIKEAEVLGTRDPWKAFYDTPRPVLSDVLVDEKVEQLPDWYKGKITSSRLVEGAYEGIDFFPKRGVSGTWLFFTAAPIRNAGGEIIGAVETLEDITERKQAEETLAESRQLFSDIISFLPDPTFVIDRDGKVLAWNRAIEQLSGISAGDIIGKGDHAYSIWQYGKGRPVLIDFVLNRDLDAARLNYTDIHRDGSTITAQTEIIHAATGKKIPLSLVASPLIDSLGNTTGAIESLRDITHIKETEAELARLNKDLEKIIRERTRALQEEVVQRQKAEMDVQAALDYTRSVIEANPDLMVVLDFEGKILD